MVLPVPDLSLPVERLGLDLLLFCGVGAQPAERLFPHVVNGQVLDQRVQLGLAQVHADVNGELFEDRAEIRLHLLVPDHLQVRMGLATHGTLLRIIVDYYINLLFNYLFYYL